MSSCACILRRTMKLARSALHLSLALRERAVVRGTVMSVSLLPALVALLVAPAPGLGAEPLTYDRVSFPVSAEREVPADQVMAVLAAQRQGPKAAELAKEVNATVAWGLDQAKEVPAVQAQTLAYATTPVYSNGSLNGWRITQSIKLQSKDAAATSELIGRLQARMLLQSVDYGLSEEKKQAVEADLIAGALADFKDRAKLIGERLGQPHYRLVEMRIDTEGANPPPVFRSAAVGLAAAEAASPPPPSIGAGVQLLRVRLSAVIELQAQ
jgi:predicted secreted protein